MATGNENANLLSTALTADSGENKAILTTSNSEALGLGAKDTIVLGKDVTNFTAAGGADNDSIILSGAGTGSDLQGNRGNDTIRVTESYLGRESRVVKTTTPSTSRVPPQPLLFLAAVVTTRLPS